MKEVVALPQRSEEPSLPLRLLAHAREKRPTGALAPAIKPNPLLNSDRAYLKALREAEMAVWNRPSAPSRAGRATETAKGRAPKFHANPNGSWVLWTWAACAGLTLLQNLHTAEGLSAKWQHFAA